MSGWGMPSPGDRHNESGIRRHRPGAKAHGQVDELASAITNRASAPQPYGRPKWGEESTAKLET